MLLPVALKIVAIIHSSLQQRKLNAAGEQHLLLWSAPGGKLAFF